MTFNGEINMIKIFDPIDPDRKYMEITDYLEVGSEIYVKTKFSNCILSLKLNEDKTIYSPEYNCLLGKKLEKLQ